MIHYIGLIGAVTVSISHLPTVPATKLINLNCKHDRDTDNLMLQVAYIFQQLFLHVDLNLKFTLPKIYPPHHCGPDLAFVVRGTPNGNN